MQTDAADLMADSTQSIPAGDLDSEVHIWRTPLDLPLAAIEMAVLSISAEEIERARRFKFQRDRHRFIVARAFLRSALARYLCVSASAVKFEYGSFGKPRLLQGAHRHAVDFNLSHCRDLALLAITRNRRVGIDVENVDHNSDLRAIASLFFSAHENAALEDTPPERRDFGVYCGWTRKEAFLKAVGHGLAYPLDAFDVSLSEVPRLLRVHDDQEAASKWMLFHLNPGPDHVGALAIEGHGVQVVWKSPEATGRLC